MIPLLLLASLVDNVRTRIVQNDPAGAEREARAYQQRSGSTPEFAAALSWVARAELGAGRLDHADALAGETRKTVGAALAGRTLDSDHWLPTALGAAIEVHAGVLAARGDRAGAVLFLRDELKTYGATSIGERLYKNVNLLSLEGKPAPALDLSQSLGGPSPVSLASLRGRPILLFFWAHWCGDCKAEAPLLALAKKEAGPQGLTIIAPTRFYGYVAGGKDAPPEEEKPYIERIRRQYYPAFSDVAVPLSAKNFLTYGASSTPTVVLIDRTGIIRLYHPGAMTLPELSREINALVKK